MKDLQLFKAIGLMSGTSMDGIDVAWIETDGEFHLNILGHFSVTHDMAFYSGMKLMEVSIREMIKTTPLASIQQTHQEMIQKIDLLHARAVGGLCKKYHVKRVNDLGVDIVGYHGQTIYHQPTEGITMQMGNPQWLANDLKIPVMGNVRQRDIQLGGQGAPIAPIYHQSLVIQDNLVPAAVINCGGISNITGVFGNDSTDLMGFDAGPGNGLLDRWVNEKTQGKEMMDKDGHYGLAGKINQTSLKELRSYSCLKSDGSGNYYDQKPPKSLDIRDFKLTESFNQLSLEDGCATLAAFTAECIVDAFDFMPSVLKNIILVGGGWYNPLILHHLKVMATKKYGHNIHIVCGDEIGWKSQYSEAELMAFLAVRRLRNLPITFPSTTGAPYPLLGGDIFYPEI